MPRQSRGPYLYLRKDKAGKAWIIRDGQKQIRTGCRAGEQEAAQRALAGYITSKHERKAGGSDPDAVILADVIDMYQEQVASKRSKPMDADSRAGFLLAYWGEKTVSEIIGKTCREYVAQRSSPSAARRELEDLRAAVNHYGREVKMTYQPRFTLPEKEPARERWLTRSEAARLLWAARRTPHLARFILIGLYTGTRSGAILGLHWGPNTVGGWVDLDRGVLYRRAAGERETKKRKPPTRLSSRLAAHMKRWQRMDQGLQPVVHWNGQTVKSVKKAWRAARDSAGLDKSVTPHVLRHTRATWLMQRGVDMWEAAGSLGMTVEILQATYGHHHEDYQRRAADAY